jgi:hypothetical protein
VRSRFARARWRRSTERGLRLSPWEQGNNPLQTEGWVGGGKIHSAALGRLWDSSCMFSSIHCPTFFIIICYSFDICRRNITLHSSMKFLIYVLNYSTVIASGLPVGLATHYGLDGQGIEYRRFSTSIQTGPGAHQASCTRGTASPSRGYSGLGIALTAQPNLAPVLGLYLYLLPWRL